MRRIIVPAWIVVLSLVPFRSGAARANVLTFVPEAADLWRPAAGALGGRAVERHLSQDTRVTGACLTVQGIGEWVAGTTGLLDLNWLDDDGLHTEQEMRGRPGGTSLGSSGALLAVRSPARTAAALSETWSYAVRRQQVEQLLRYAADGVFTLGFEPVRPAENNAAARTIAMFDTMPEPATVMALALGAIPIVLAQRRVR